jgi:hypothetical protein
MATISQQIRNLQAELPPGVTLVAVSKTYPPEIIMKAYEAGQRDFGENRVQEVVAKQPLLPPDIRWHLIGHLQTNKAKYIAPFVSMVHSVDSVKLLQEINKEAARNNRIINCLLQIYIAEEDSKFGFTEEEVISMLKSNPPGLFKNIIIKGVMGMATFTDHREQVRQEFRKLKSIFGLLKSEFFGNSDDFCEISMGMSGDYDIAIEEGSTMVRIGSRIFGER